MIKIKYENALSFIGGSVVTVLLILGCTRVKTKLPEEIQLSSLPPGIPVVTCFQLLSVSVPTFMEVTSLKGGKYGLNMFFVSGDLSTGKFTKMLGENFEDNHETMTSIKAMKGCPKEGELVGKFLARSQ